MHPPAEGPVHMIIGVTAKAAHKPLGNASSPDPLVPDGRPSFFGWTIAGFYSACGDPAPPTRIFRASAELNNHVSAQVKGLGDKLSAAVQ